MVESVHSYSVWCEQMLGASYPLKISSKINDNLQRQKSILENQSKFLEEQVGLYRVSWCLNTSLYHSTASQTVRITWSCAILPKVWGSQMCPPHSNSIFPLPFLPLFLTLSLVVSTLLLPMMMASLLYCNFVHVAMHSCWFQMGTVTFLVTLPLL